MQPYRSQKSRMNHFPIFSYKSLIFRIINTDSYIKLHVVKEDPKKRH